MKRRNFLLSMAGSTLGLTMAGRGVAQSGVVPLNISEIAPGIHLIRNAGANIVAATTPEGWTVVDSGASAAASMVSAALRERAATPVQVLFNTAWRETHTGGNEALGGQDIRILAHENTRLWMGADFEIAWEDRTHLPRPHSAQPNETFYTGGDIDVGGLKVRYDYLPQAHSDGDIYVHMPDHNVLVVGELLGVDSYPVCDYVTAGWIGGMLQANKNLLELTDNDTKVIAAYGAVHARATLQAHATMLEAVFQAVTDTYRSGQSLQEFIASRPTRDFDDRYGNPELFLTLVYRGAYGHVRELGRIV
ncbi:MAG: MBL fold metallo-hydrolase [Gammaproteobacteria bacterium]|nr:MBL fold metallo-hydrolase [Gammaproteobacteria bacterium]